MDTCGWFYFSISATQHLATPDNGTGYSNNKMMCSDGKIAYCKDATEQFEQGQSYDGCKILGNYLIGRQNKSKVIHKRLNYRSWFICQYTSFLYSLQAIDEDKMNDVEFLLKNGEDAMSKNLAEGKNHGA